MFVIEAITGGKEIDAALKTLDERAQNKSLGAALRVGGKPLLDDAIAHVPVKSGQLKQSLRTQLTKTKAGRAIAVGTGAKWFTGDEFYGAFQEFGWHAGPRTKKRQRVVSSKGKIFTRINKTGDSRPFHEGRHFVEGAFDRHARQAVDAFLVELRIQIDKAMADAASQSKTP